MKQLTIGKLAQLSGTTPDTLRYYEKMKLLKGQGRSPAGYRLYTPDTIQVIRFIRGAKALNFTLEEIRELLIINTSDRATCAQIVKQTEGKIAEAETKIKELKKIKKVLTALVKKCPRGSNPIKACPIIDHIRGNIKLSVLLLLAATFTPHNAHAKPISYPGGVMAMQENDETGHTLSLDYTLSPNYAIGLYAKQEAHEKDGREFQTIGPQLNTLIKRWNMPDGQANIFNMTGVGASYDHGTTGASAWSSILADYETRRVFTSYELRGMYADHIDQSVWQRARVGVVPYLANYEDLNTWFMLQADDHPSKAQSFVVTPLIRFFYKTTLVEAGYSSNHHAMFNWQLQFKEQKMHKLLITLMLASLATPASAETIRASVNGLVCAFCATGIEKSFKAQSSVETVKVDLDNKLVTIDTKKNQSMDDATITKTITDAGFSVTNIERKK